MKYKTVKVRADEEGNITITAWKGERPEKKPHLIHALHNYLSSEEYKNDVITLPTKDNTKLQKHVERLLYNKKLTSEYLHTYFLSEAKPQAYDWIVVKGWLHLGPTQVTKIDQEEEDGEKIMYASNGDWYKPSEVQKIEATTDESLWRGRTYTDAQHDFDYKERLPQIPQSFVETYAKSSETALIKKVQLEMQEACCIDGIHFAYCVEECKKPKLVFKTNSNRDVIVACMNI